MKRQQLVLLLLVIVLLVSFSSYAENPTYKHLLGYETVLSKATSDPFYKYGIYSSRIITVANPEVYIYKETCSLLS